MKIKYIDLFCGIGGFRFAADVTFTQHGTEPLCVFSSDIDEHARKAYYANFGELPFGDITKINPFDIPDHDILFAGFPCQPFSIIGNGNGFHDTRGTLFFNIVNILKAKQPIGFVLENVKRLVSHRQGQTLKTIIQELNKLGYEVDYKVLNALDYGLPQKRERVFIVGFKSNHAIEWPKKIKERLALSDILEKDVPLNYYASEYIKSKRKLAHETKHYPSIWHENKAGNVSSYPYSCALRAGASHNYLLVNGERRLTPREMLRLQGFPESFKIVVPDAQVRKQAGNAVPVNLVRSVLESCMPVLKKIYQNKNKESYGLTGRYGRKEIASFANCRQS